MRHSALPFRATAAAVVGLLCLSACEQHPVPLASPANSTSRAAPSPPAPEPSAPVTRADAPDAPLIAVPAEPEPVNNEAPGVRALQEGMPPAVRDFIRRAVICNHWAGEEPYNEERRAQMAAAVSSLRCRELDTDQKELRSRYAKDAAVLARIAQSRRSPL
jgi:hypothetical protein